MYYPIIYTRTFYKDFRMICKPPTTVISVDLLGDFERFIRQVINTDKISNKQINTVRYSYLKKEGYILWGIGCINTEIGIPNEYGTDCKHRSRLRSFIGIIFDQSSDLKLTGVPFTSSFFKEIFESYVIPNWDFPEHKQWKIIDSKPLDDFSVTTIFPEDKMQISFSHECCEVYAKDINIENLIASIITKETSLVTGLNVKSHIINAYQQEVFIQNAICLDENNGQKIKFKSIEKTKNKEENNINTLIDYSQNQKIDMISQIKEKLPKLREIPRLLSHISMHKRELNLHNKDVDTSSENSLTNTNLNSSMPNRKRNLDSGQSMRGDIESVKCNDFEKSSDNSSDLLNINSQTNINNNMESIYMNWDEFGKNSEVEGMSNDNANSSREETSIDDLHEIIAGKLISEKYKEMLSELKSSISSIDNYNISSEKYIEIEGIIKELIKKFES